MERVDILYLTTQAIYSLSLHRVSEIHATLFRTISANIYRYLATISSLNVIFNSAKKFYVHFFWLKYNTFLKFSGVVLCVEILHYTPMTTRTVSERDNLSANPRSFNPYD